MTCLKCGRETEDVFCETCLEQMNERPVRNASVLLNKRERDAYYARKQRPIAGVNLSAEKLKKAGRKIRRLRIINLLLVLLILAAGAAAWYLYNSGTIRPLGRNFSVTVHRETEPSETNNETEGVSRETIR